MPRSSATPPLVTLVTALTLCAWGCGAPAAGGEGGATEPSSAGSEASAPAPDVRVEPWTLSCTRPVEALSQVEDAARFLQLLAPAGLPQTFDEMRGATVFVPTNAALDALPASIERDPAALRNFLAGHFTMGTVSTELLREAGTVELLDQQRTTLPVAASRGTTAVGPAHVLRPDLRCEGVTVHMIDAILPVAALDPSMSPNPFQVNLWRLPAE